MIKLTEDQLKALQQNPYGVRCEDDTTNKVYVLLDEQAFVAVHEQEDWKAIQAGIAAADAGHMMSVDEAATRLRDGTQPPQRP